jgi:L-rhamnose mutarotase
MERIGFVFELNEGSEAAYDESHQSVPADLLEMFVEIGISNYSSYRYGTLVFSTLTAKPDWDTAASKMMTAPSMNSWVQVMDPYIKWQVDESGSLHLLPEVFRFDGEV